MKNRIHERWVLKDKVSGVLYMGNIYLKKNGIKSFMNSGDSQWEQKYEIVKVFISETDPRKSK